MALATKSGALWQMSRAEKDEGWTDEGHNWGVKTPHRNLISSFRSSGQALPIAVTKKWIRGQQFNCCGLHFLC